MILTRPGRPCLTCLGELDSAEIGRWAKSLDQQALDRLYGYGTGTPNPSVVYLNGLSVSAALRSSPLGFPVPAHPLNGSTSTLSGPRRILAFTSVP